MTKTTKTTKPTTAKPVTRPAPKSAPTQPVPAPIRTVRTIHPAPKPAPAVPDPLARLRGQCHVLYSKSFPYTLDVGLVRLPSTVRALSLPQIAIWIADNLPAGWRVSAVRLGSDYSEFNATAEVSFRAYARIESED